MSDQPLISYAQNGEDVVLWRALGHVVNGTYVDVGGWDPDVDSVTRALYDRGWTGIDVEPVPEFAQKFRERRPRNEVVQAVVSDAPEESMVLHRFGTTGLSTVDDGFAARHDRAGLQREDIVVPARRLDDVLATSALALDPIHFLKIDVEGAEAQVLRSINLQCWRPWVLVIEATEPNSTESSHVAWESLVIEAGYTFALFDGLSRFYLSCDHPELADDLAYPACALDDYERAEVLELRATSQKQARELSSAQSQVTRWRNEAVNYWANAVAAAQTSEDATRVAQRQADAHRRKVSQLRGKLQQARTNRRRLQDRIKRLTERVQVLESKTAARAEAGSRLRRSIRRMRGAV